MEVINVSALFGFVLSLTGRLLSIQSTFQHCCAPGAHRRAAALPTSRSASNLHLVYFYPLSTSLEEICGSTLAASSQDGATLRPTYAAAAMHGGAHAEINWVLWSQIPECHVITKNFRRERFTLATLAAVVVRHVLPRAALPRHDDAGDSLDCW